MRDLTTATRLPWTGQDVTTAARHLRAHRFTEAEARALLERFAAEGVRNPWRVVASLPAARLAVLLVEVQAELMARHEAAAARERHDLVHLRISHRWPWRTSTSQTFGGAVA